MSDTEVIKRFLGKFHSDGLPSNEDPKHAQYYPKPGVNLSLEQVALDGAAGKAYVKIRIEPGPVSFGGKLALERAVFRVENDTLVARDMEVLPGLLVVETLTIDKARRMTHQLSFSDGSLGSWVCVP
jgi:hypothetical protein